MRRILPLIPTFLWCSLGWSATQLNLHLTPGAVTGYHAMSPSPEPTGGTAASSFIHTTSGSTRIHANDVSSSGSIAWMSEPVATPATIAASSIITFNVYTGDATAGNNAGLEGVLLNYRGGVLGSPFCSGYESDPGTSLTTARNFTCSVGSSTTLAAGDRIALEIFFVNCATGSCPNSAIATASPGVTPLYDGPAATSGASYVSFPQAITFEAESGAGGTPAIVQGITTPDIGNGGQTMAAGSSAMVPLPTGTTAGDAIILIVTDGDNSGNALSISDDKSNRYSLAIQCPNPNTSAAIYVYIVPNAVAGTRKITVKVNSAQIWFHAVAWEMSNIATANALDGSSCNAPSSSSTLMSAGKLPTLTQSGDYVFQFVEQYNAGSPGTITVGSLGNGSFTLEESGATQGGVLQDGVYSSTASLIPTLTETNSLYYSSVAVALKSSNSGGGQTGIRPTWEHVYNYGYLAPNTFSVQLPVHGNLLYISYDGGESTAGANCAVSSLTTTPNNTVNHLGCAYGPNSATATEDAFYIASPATTSGQITANFRLTNTNFDETVYIFDIAGAAASPVDNYQTAGGFASATCSGATCPSFNSISITPASASSELEFSGISIGYNTVTGTATSQASLLNGYLSSNGPGNSSYFQNDGMQTYSSSSTNPIVFGWNFQSGIQAQVGDWASNAVAFKAAQLGSQPLPPTGLKAMIQ